jgi:ABC-type lipoprotein export system ATPase subunit
MKGEILMKNKNEIHSITILGGQDKSGKAEDIQLTISQGDIICIVGPTGAGKTRLLEDIECLAQRDTPTQRGILINGNVPTNEQRFDIENKLVAQLSQNMNFIMELTVGEFITMHAESRELENDDCIVQKIVSCANELTGEKFNENTPVTQLSGGQSRSLMIADTALLSPSPIVLIDEIENAGVDRKKALKLLVKEDKIILLSTHDPILALQGDKRINIRNGAIHAVLETSSTEKGNLEFMEFVDNRMLELRNRLRNGERLEFDVRRLF